MTRQHTYPDRMAWLEDELRRLEIGHLDDKVAAEAAVLAAKAAPCTVPVTKCETGMRTLRPYRIDKYGKRMR